MFTKETVFVLGAGASWHYGYPTGETLVQNVISMANRLSSYCVERMRSGQLVQHIPDYVDQRIDRSKGNQGAADGWKLVCDECQTLIDRLQSVRPLIIDYFFKAYGDVSGLTLLANPA
jgi:hypothetical protein